MLRLSYFVILILCIFPTLIGLVGTFSTAFSYLPPLGFTALSLDGFLAVWEWGGVNQSILLSLTTSLASTYLACFITFLILQHAWGTAYWVNVQRVLSPLIAMPHVAFVIGMTFLFAPTGMGMRILHSATGIEFPQYQAAWLVHDPYGVGLIFALTLKEIPFLLLMSLTLLPQLNVDNIVKISASMGYSRPQAWIKCIFPLWLSKMRFPLFAVIAYCVSVVDLSLIIGPTNPPTFAILLWQWFTAPDLAHFPRAGAGAVILFFMAFILIAAVRLIEWIITTYCRQWQFSGRHGGRLGGKHLFLFFVSLYGLTLPLLLLWSVAKRWRFPDLLPSQFSGQFWQHEWSNMLPHIHTSITLALLSATGALVLAILAHEYKLRHRCALPDYLIVIPLVVPQLSLLFGIQIGILSLHGDAYYFWVCWSHLFFAFPYIYLSLDGAWRGYNLGFTRVALSLGQSPWQVWYKVKMPLLFPAIIMAWAVGISVSLAQYLPTLLLGAGRISTLTTEAVALTSGFDRRVTAIYALCQAILPFIFFSLAFAINRWQQKNQYKDLAQTPVRLSH